MRTSWKFPLVVSIPAVVLGIAYAEPADAQTSRAQVVAACGTPPGGYAVGSTQNLLQDTTGKACSAATATLSGSVSATISGALPPYAATPLGVGFQTNFGTATALPTIPTGAVCAVIAVETNSMRWRDDGTAPTSGTGMLQAVGQPLTICEVSGSPGLAGVQFIPTTASGSIDVSYYK